MIPQENHDLFYAQSPLTLTPPERWHIGKHKKAQSKNWRHYRTNDLYTCLWVSSSQMCTIHGKILKCFQSTKTKRFHRSTNLKKRKKTSKRRKLARVQFPLTLLAQSGTLKVKITCAITTWCVNQSNQDDSESSVLLSYAVQIMHFWVQSVNKESQEIIAISKTTFWMLDELRSLGELLLIIHILFVWGHRFKSIQCL